MEGINESNEKRFTQIETLYKNIAEQFNQYLKNIEESFDNIKKDLDQHDKGTNDQSTDIKQLENKLNKSINLLKQEFEEFEKESSKQLPQEELINKYNSLSKKFKQQETKLEEINKECNEIMKYFIKTGNKLKKYSLKNKESKENFKTINKQTSEMNEWLNKKIQELHEYIDKVNNLAKSNEIKINKETEKSGKISINIQNLDKKIKNEKLKITKLNKTLNDFDNANKEKNNNIQSQIKKMEKSIEEVKNTDNLLDKLPKYEGSFSLGDDCFYNGNVINSSGKGKFKNTLHDFEIEGYFKNNSLNINKPFTFTGKFRNPMTFELTSNKKINNFKISMEELSKVERTKCENDSIYLIFPKKETSNYTEDKEEGIIFNENYIYKGELNSLDDICGEGIRITSEGKIFKNKC